jgi:hypothetical protein
MNESFGFTNTRTSHANPTGVLSDKRLPGSDFLPGLEGDTLVVDTIGFNDRAWLDAFGHPRSEDLHVTERFTRRDFGHMDLAVTMDDPKMYTKSFTFKVSAVLLPDTDVLEAVCAENENDLAHMPKQ